MKRKIPLATPRIVSYTADTSSHESMPELIRCRAYEIFEARGGQSGHGIEDWLPGGARDKSSLGDSVTKAEHCDGGDALDALLAAISRWTGDSKTTSFLRTGKQ